jgi:membrane protease YdiL (CAAX protease family)
MSSPDAGGARAQRLWYEVLAVLCIAVLPSVYGAIVGLLGEPLPPLSLRAESVGYLLSAVFVTVPVLYLVEHSRDGAAHFGLKPVRPVFDVLVGVGVWLLAWRVEVIAFTALYTVAPAGIGPNVERDPVLYPQDAGDWMLLVLACAGIGFWEELVRAYLITRFAELLRSRVLAVVLSAAVFASYHLYQGVERTLALWVMGLWLGCAFLWLRRVWPLAFGHALWDLWVLGFEPALW